MLIFLLLLVALAITLAHGSGRAVLLWPAVLVIILALLIAYAPTVIR